MAGEEIKGNVGIKVKESIRVARLSLRFLGSVHTAWKDKFTNIAYESVELVLDEYRDVTSELSQHCNGIMELFSGEHNIEFHFKLSIDSVSSVGKDGYGRVKYCCVASLDVPDEGGDNEIVAEKEFAVVSYLNLDAPHFRSPAHSFEQMIVIGIFCGRPRGWMSVDLCVSELGLMPGETYEVTLTVENTLKKGRRKNHLGEGHQCGLISLCQQIDFRARAKNKPHTWERRSLTTAVQSHGVCKANCAKGPETKQTHFQIPDDLAPTSTKENGLIACTYFFRIEMDGQFDVVVPVVVGSQKNKRDLETRQ
uniref:Arrestin C-terminal-like domain-containing protein n=1 Tax=Globodera rostochiensis TaxID=31243 RepID=A0A914GTJ2_GLORO